MTLPAQISVSFDYTNGATFGFQGFVIGDAKFGIIGTGQLGSGSTGGVIDLTPNVYHISITRGRNIQRDTYEAGTAVIRVLDPLSYFNPQNVSSPYYGYLAPLRKIRVAATTKTTQNFLDISQITNIPIQSIRILVMSIFHVLMLFVYSRWLIFRRLLVPQPDKQLQLD
jgi:hypothetical protein